MKRAIKVRIHPDDEQTVFLTAQFGAVRFVFNKALPIMRHQYQRHGVSLKPRRDIKPLLVVAKNSRRYHWLKEYDSQALQQGVINIDRALNNFFQHRAKFPRFKSKHGKQSRYHPNGKVFADAIPLPKMKPIKEVIHHKFIGTVSSLTITCTATGKYYAAILVDDGKKAVIKDPVITQMIGLDMGSCDFVITSNGDKIPNPCFLTRASEQDEKPPSRACDRGWSWHRFIQKGTPVLKRAIVAVIRWLRCPCINVAGFALFAIQNMIATSMRRTTSSTKGSMI